MSFGRRPAAALAERLLFLIAILFWVHPTQQDSNLGMWYAAGCAITDYRSSAHGRGRPGGAGRSPHPDHVRAPPLPDRAGQSAGPASPPDWPALGCDDQTVRNTIHAFNQHGVAALTPGSSVPQHTPPAVVTPDHRRLRTLLEQSPRTFGEPTSVWTLKLVAKIACAEGVTPRLVTGETIRTTLAQLDVPWKRATHWMASPHPAYQEKKAPRPTDPVRRTARRLGGRVSRSGLEELRGPAQPVDLNPPRCARPPDQKPPAVRTRIRSRWPATACMCGRPRPTPLLSRYPSLSVRPVLTFSAATAAAGHSRRTASARRQPR